MDSIPCKVCGKMFSDIRYVYEHTRRMHGKKNFQCSLCSYAACYKYRLEAHIKRQHLQENNKAAEHECTLCSTYKTLYRKSMIYHYVAAHGVDVQPCSLEFKNVEEFETWKLEVERTNKCRFVQKRGVQILGKKKVYHYYCFRDGIYSSTGKGKRKLKRLGSNKIGGICPAHIKTSEDLETSFVHVEYVQQHVGHSSEIGRLNLSRSEKDEIARQLAANVPSNVVLDRIRESSRGDQVERFHLTTWKDLWNVQREYNIRGGSYLQPKDYASVQEWIATMQNEHDFVRFYKPQNCSLPDRPELEVEDFVLIVANDAQLEMLKTYGPLGICMDGTQVTNQSDVELTTVLLLDEINKGFPCSFLVSNRHDSIIISLFAAVLEEALQSAIETETFMSDLPDRYYDGWCQAMPVPQHRLYSTWHVDGAWRKNISKIRDFQKRAEVYNVIRNLMEEPDENAFRTHLDGVRAFFEHDDDCLDFGLYFQRTFADTVRSWASCYRPYLSAITNMHLEEMHNVIKHEFLEVKKTKRLDKAIDALVKFTRDKLYDKLIVAHSDKTSWKTPAVQAGHSKSVKMSSTIVPSAEGWLITSHPSNETYEVTKHKASCACSVKCVDCDECIHAFRCTCPDSTIKWNFCEHIHYAILFSKGILPEANLPDVSDAGNEESLFDVQEEIIISDIVEHLSPGNTKTSDNENKKQKILDGFVRLLNAATTEEHLEVIESALEPVQSAMDAIDAGIAELDDTTDFLRFY